MRICSVKNTYGIVFFIKEIFCINVDIIAFLFIAYFCINNFIRSSFVLICKIKIHITVST